MIMRRTLGPKGQVVIPKDVRKHLGVEPGSEVIFEVKENEVVMKPSRPPADAVEEYVSIVTSKLKRMVRLDEIIEGEVLEEVAIHRQ